ncbi:MAG: 30S ribosomal protein S16 [Actinobacteria bacterium]|nr:30S ribosomal protein S16 [Actinomycetota bacterium]MBU1942939.1 30S ribosomal protein S16 [Actinomycetota bacterium]MBU2687319.1 30S ribosomal protein S16 [Actinomycetota bacterium]
MLVKIRLRRMGKKKQPSYRIVVADSRAPRDGRYIESLGYYNPMTEPSTIELDGERALYWLGKGAQPTQQVEKLMKIKGVWEQFQGSRKK